MHCSVASRSVIRLAQQWNSTKAWRRGEGPHDNNGESVSSAALGLSIPLPDLRGDADSGVRVRGPDGWEGRQTMR